MYNLLINTLICGGTYVRSIFIKNRRIRGLCAVLLVIGTVLSGCGNNKLIEGTENSQIIYSDTTGAEPLTIGYTFWDLTFDGFMNDQANQIKLVADALNVNLIFNPDTEDFSADSVVRAAEYFAKQGVDGMIVINFSNGSLVDISKICEDSKIPFIQATRTIDDPETASIVEANPYYIGRMHESEYAAAYEVGRKLIDKGAKNIIMVCPEHGDNAYEARAKGFRDACEEPDVNILEEVWELADDDGTSAAVKQLIQKYPETDGIFSIRGGFFPFIVSAEDELGLDKYIPISGVDFDKSLAPYIESGAIEAVAGGHHADASLSLITLVNAIRGSYDTSLYPLDINYNMMVIDSIDAFNDYKKWCLGYDEDYDNRQILNANDARGLCVDFNKETTLSDITAFAENMSLEGVKERHKGLVK